MNELIKGISFLENLKCINLNSYIISFKLVTLLSPSIFLSLSVSFSFFFSLSLHLSHSLSHSLLLFSKFIHI